MMNSATDPFGARATLSGDGWTVAYYRLAALAEQGLADLDRLPMTVKICLENVLRRFDGRGVTEDHIRGLAGWDPTASTEGEVPFMPARVLLQDFTGVPAI